MPLMSTEATNDTLTAMTISVLASQKEYIEEQASIEGFATPSEYLRQLVHEDQRRKAQERLEELLLEGLNGQSTIMNKQDWDEIRTEVRRKAGEGGAIKAQE